MSLKGFHYLSALLKHYIVSTPIDILHSPFVFSLYNTCFNRSTALPVSTNNAAPKLLQRLVQFIPAKQGLLIDDQLKQLQPNTLMGTEFTFIETPTIQIDAIHSMSNFDLIYLLNYPDEKLLERINWFIPMMHNKSILVIDQPYKTRTRESAWKSIQQLNTITVTVDFFFIGLISIRQEQVKQNFKLRMW